MLESYCPPATIEGELTCVGLGLELLGRLPGRLDGRAHLVSCEETVDHPHLYTAAPHPTLINTEKEHVLVCAQLDIGGRTGVILLDPGYHVARVVTVMHDGLYPHTGWFTQNDEEHSRKEYRYSFASNNKDYVVWEVRELKRGNDEKHTLSLIYVGRPFLNPVEVTEKRNLVYNFRSWLVRDTKGHVTGGIYFPVPEPGRGPGQFTIMYPDGQSGIKKRRKIAFTSFLSYKGHLDNEDTFAVETCGQQLGLPAGKLADILAKLANILSDTNFISQVLKIDQEILNISP